MSKDLDVFYDLYHQIFSDYETIEQQICHSFKQVVQSRSSGCAVLAQLVHCLNQAEAELDGEYACRMAEIQVDYCVFIVFFSNILETDMV